jgi:long-chain acyl-CoA synthetase
VVITLPTGPNLALALFAVARAGLIAVPIGPSRGDTGAVADRVGAIAGISLQNDHGLPIAIGPAHLAQWWSAGPADRPAAIGGGEDLVLLARARGDRAVMLSHRAVLAAVLAIGRVGGLRLQDFDRALQVLPMYHVAGWVVGFLPLALVGGATVVPQIGFDPANAGAGGEHDHISAAGRQAAESALEAARQHQVTVVPGAPGFYHHLIALPGAQEALSSARLLTSGMAPVDSDDFAAVRELVGKPVWEGYGLSESASVVTSSLTGPEPAAHSVGRPVTGLELRIIGADGRDVNAADGPEPADEAQPANHDPFDFVAEVPDAGEVGRIVIRGATLFSGYWPEGVGGPGADGWFVTGDIGYLDDAGELHLVDRAAETLNVAGFTVYPREVEVTLAERPDIADVAVIGVPDGDGHDRVVAVLVTRPGDQPTLDDLFEFAAERLPVFKRPVDYHLVPALPRTEVGRLDRAAVLRSYEHSPRPDRGRAPKLSAVPAADDHDPAGPADGRSVNDGADLAAESAVDEVDTTPEQAGELSELGVRLPWTGDRVDRGEQDTDDDMF